VFGCALEELGATCSAHLKGLPFIFFEQCRASAGNIRVHRTDSVVAAFGAYCVVEDITMVATIASRDSRYPAWPKGDLMQYTLGEYAKGGAAAADAKAAFGTATVPEIVAELRCGKCDFVIISGSQHGLRVHLVSCLVVKAEKALQKAQKAKEVRNQRKRKREDFEVNTSV
jgi:hypothetical protein